MPPCLCGHQYREHRDGGACTRCSRCLIFEPDEPPTAKRPLTLLDRMVSKVTDENRQPAVNLGPDTGLEIPEPAGESRSQPPEQEVLPFPPEFPPEIPVDDRDASDEQQADPRPPEADPWWLDA